MCLQWFPLSSPWRVTCRMHTTNARLSPDHVSLEGGVALRRVDDNDVDMFRRQRLNALVIALTSPDCSSCILTMVRPRDVHTPATSRHSVVRLRELTQSKLEASQSRASLRLRKQSSQGPRTAKELFRCLVHRTVRKVTIFEQVGARDERHQVSLRVDDGKLALLAVFHELVGLRQGASFFGCGVGTIFDVSAVIRQATASRPVAEGRTRVCH